MPTMPADQVPNSRIDILNDPPNPFFDSVRISRAINDPNKNFLKTIWQKGKPVLDSELNEREDIDSFIRRQTAILLAGELTVVKGLFPEQSTVPNRVCFSAGEIYARGWDLIVEKNEGGFPPVNQNFTVTVLNGNDPNPLTFPLNGLGFSPQLNFDQPVGDNSTTIIASGTFYDDLKRKLCVELENSCSLSAITYNVQTLDQAYGKIVTIAPGQRATVCLKENLTNFVTLPNGPTITQGTRQDTIYLQVGEVEICSTVADVKRNGHISHPQVVPSNIFDPNVGFETTRRTQIQFDIRSCIGNPPTPPKGFYIYPLFRVARKSGQVLVKLEDITTLVAQIDLTKSGIFELIKVGAGISHNTIININDDSTVSDPSPTIVVGSTLHIRNCSLLNNKTFLLYNETFTLKPGESFGVNFNQISNYPLQDVTQTAVTLAIINVVGWGSASVVVEELGNFQCAIGNHYFPGSAHDGAALHPCYDGPNPVQGTEQSLDVRLESVVLDIFESAVSIAAAREISRTRLSYLFVDTFSDLEFVIDTDKENILHNGAWNADEADGDFGDYTGEGGFNGFGYGAISLP